MPAYLTRAERLNLSFPVIFSADGDTLRGSCRNISLSGLSAGFSHPPEVWVTGALAIETGSSTITLQVRVARVLDREAGFAFLIQTDADRQAVASLVAFAAANTQLTGNPPM